MKPWAIGVLAACAALAVVLVCVQPAEARIHIHVGAYLPGYYYPYYGPYAVRYPARYVAPPVWMGPPVRVYAYPPAVYGPPAYVPLPPPPPCPRYQVWEW